MSEHPIDMSMMIFMDPPAHTRMRALVSRAFTPRRMNALEERIRELCRLFFDQVEGNSSFDYVQDFAARLPALVIASLGVGAPVIIYFAGGEKAAGALDSLKSWMAANNSAIMAVMMLVIGAKLFGDGISGL